MSRKEQKNEFKKKKNYKQVLENIFQKTGSWSQYSEISKIGEGSWSNVFKAKNLRGQDLAIKVLKQHGLQDEKCVLNLARQIKILKTTSRQCYFTEFIDTMILSDNTGVKSFCILMKLQLMDLRRFIDTELKNLSFNQRLNLCINIVKSVGKLHQLKIIHRDLKPGNFLIRKNSEGYIPLLNDFGLSKYVEENIYMTLTVGNPKYKNPFIQKEKIQYSYQFDIYSLGLIIYQVLTGRFICQFTKEQLDEKNKLWNRIIKQLQNIKTILNQTPQLKGKENQQIRDIIQDCLNLQSAKKMKIYQDIEMKLNRASNKIRQQIFQSQLVNLIEKKKQSDRQNTADTNKTDNQISSKIQLISINNKEENQDLMQSHLSRSQKSYIKSSRVPKKYQSDLDRTPQQNQYNDLRQICRKQKFQIEVSSDEQQDGSNQIKIDFKINLITNNIETNKNRVLLKKLQQKNRRDQQKLNQRYMEINYIKEKYLKKIQQTRKWLELGIQYMYKRALILLGLMFIKHNIKQSLKNKQSSEYVQNFYKFFNQTYQTNLNWCRSNGQFVFSSNFRRYVTDDIEFQEIQIIMSQVNFVLAKSEKYVQKSLFNEFFK